MATRISSAPVDQSLIMLQIKKLTLRKRGGIGVKYLSLLFLMSATIPALAQEKNGFFQKHYAEDIVEIDPEGSSVFDSPSNNRNAPKVRDYKDRMEEFQAELDEKLAEQKAANASKAESFYKKNELKREKFTGATGPKRSPVKAPGRESSREFSELGVEDSRDESSESDMGVDQETSQLESDNGPEKAFEPINPKDYKKITIDMVISATPQDHFFEQIRRGGEVSKIKRVEIGAVTVIGQPNLSIEFVEALKSFKAAEGKMTFASEPPEGLNVTNSPTWIINLDGRKVVFEGQFSIDEIFERR